MTGYSLIAQYQPRNRGNQKDSQRDTKQRSTAQEMPDLPAPFVQDGDCHWYLWHNEVNVTLWYDRQCAQWNVRFDWPIQDMQFQRDTPAMEIREKIIEVIDNKWLNDLDSDSIPF